MKNSKLINSTVAGNLAVGATVASQLAFAVPDALKNWKKCSGITKIGKNNCGALDGSHQCAEQAKEDNLNTE
jgi:uncharacterized membrane protein